MNAVIAAGGDIPPIYGHGGSVMHIAIDGTAAINDVSAIQRYCYHLIAELSHLLDEDEASILYLGYKKSFRLPEIDRRHVREITSRIPGRFLRISWRFCGLPSTRYWIGNDIDIVHFPAGYPYIPHHGKTVVTTLHGIAPLVIPDHLPAPAVLRARRQIESAIASSTHLITVSESNRQEVLARWQLPEDRVTTIPLGVSPEFREQNVSEIPHAMIQKFGLPRDKRMALFVGVLAPHKNIANLIKGFSLFHQENGNTWHLVLVGRQSIGAQPYRQQIADLQLAHSVTLIDHIDPGSQELPALYNLAELLIFPTLYEGWASPPLEAMACGTPVVVSDIPSLRESTGGNAVYVNPVDPEDIATGVDTLIRDNALYSRLQKMGKEFANEFTWRRCAERTLATYKRVVPG